MSKYFYGNEHKFTGNNIHIARHVETRKNTLDIHGASNECNPTRWTEYQISALCRYIEKHGIKKIISCSTAQCIYTSNALKLMLDIDVIDLGLSPINLGEYAGLSHSEFRKKNSCLANAMELFRYRVLPYNKTTLTKLSDPNMMAKEIYDWWIRRGQYHASDVIYILSNSLIVKLVNFFQNILPNSDRYLNIGFANGATISLDGWDFNKEQWPAVNHKTLVTNRGDVIACEFIPKLSMFNNVTALIYPGIFGSSRFGPYNLFNRMARKFSDYGIKSIVFDPIGSGEATPIYRSTETELASLLAVINYYGKSNSLALCAHSLSANLLYKHISSTKIYKYLIAPIIDIDVRRAAWDIEGENMIRHGLEFSTDLWDDYRLASFGNDINVDFYFGTSDRYVDYHQIDGIIGKERIHFIDGAGHNFSEGDTSNVLIQQMLEDILKYSWKCNGQEGNCNIMCTTKP